MECLERCSVERGNVTRGGSERHRRAYDDATGKLLRFVRAALLHVVIGEPAHHVVPDALFVRRPQRRDKQSFRTIASKTVDNHFRGKGLQDGGHHTEINDLPFS